MQDHTAEDEIGKSSTTRKSNQSAFPLCALVPFFRLQFPSHPNLLLLQSLKRRNSPLMADVEIFLVRWICLDSQAGSEDELSDGRAEAGEEGIEGLEKKRGVSAIYFWRERVHGAMLCVVDSKL
jgi:hypothetical protein